MRPAASFRAEIAEKQEFLAKSNLEKNEEKI